MKFIYVQLVTLIFVGIIGSPVVAQNARKANYKKANLETKTIRGCDYQVLKGLAEITAVEKVKDKAESALRHDEYSVKFKFVPMEEGHVLMGSLQDQELEFVLRSGWDKVPVGPKYLEHYYVRKGLKFAMQFMQNRKGECKEKYTYESRGIPNDLFESQENDHLMDYKKQIAEEKVFAKEAEYEAAKNGVDPETFNKVPTPNWKRKIQLFLLLQNLK